MNDSDLEYAKMAQIVKPYTDKGRPISIAFLNWFLEHIYRLDQVAAEDTICDKSNDRGIDGIYVDENQLEIHVLQSKTKQNGTIGDKDLREFSGTLNQLRTTDSLDAFVSGKVDPEIKDKIQKLGLRGLLEKGFSLRGIFVTNVPIDANGLDVIKADPSIIPYDRAAIAKSYVDLNVEGGVKQKYTFAIDGSPLTFQAGTLAKVLVLFADGRELAAMPGIADGLRRGDIAEAAKHSRVFELNACCGKVVGVRGRVFGLRPRRLAEHFQHQFHRHQHRIVAARQPAHGDAPQIVYQGYVQRCLQRAVFA
jgi:hypothetical protein